MATENPMRIVDSSAAGNWAPSRSTASFAPSVSSVVVDELGLLLRGHDLHDNQSSVAPNRSGSAPPNMEGSFASFGNLVNQQNLSNSRLAALGGSSDNFQSQELLLADPSYPVYYHSNTNLNARLPRRTFTREDIDIAREARVPGNNWRLPSADARIGEPLYITRSSLSTHEEESEEDRSPEGALDDRAGSGGVTHEQKALSSTARHKSLVDLIQEDFPRTPSPVFSQSHSPGHVEEPLNNEVESLSLDSMSFNAFKSPEPKSSIGSGCKNDPSPVSAEVKDSSATSIPENSCLDPTGTSLSTEKHNIIIKDTCFSSDFVNICTIGSDASKILHEVDDRHKHEVGFDEENEYLQDISEHIPGYHIPTSQSEGAGPIANDNGEERVPQGHVQITSVGMQQVLHSPLVRPPLYTTAAAYMAPANSFYANFGSSGIHTPQYSGYALGSSLLSPYLAGYPPHTGYPFHFNASSEQSFNVQNASYPTGESFSRGSVMQNSNRFYGPHGPATHPTLPEPLSLQYFQQTMQDPYGVSLQYSHLPSPGMVGSQVGPFNIRNAPSGAAYTDDQKFHVPSRGRGSIPSPRKMGVPSTSYLSSPTGLGFVPQFTPSPLGSPILSDSPVQNVASLGRRSDSGFSHSSARNFGGYARWPGQRHADFINEPRKHSYLEELKSNSAQRIDLSDIVGRVVEFSVDQHGSRFIQQKLENCSVEEKESVFKEVLPHASELITDVFGNYVIQKFFEYGTYEQRKELANHLSGQMLPLSLQMYGCRVIQKALEVIEVDQKTKLVLELDGHVMRCVRDQNGNHVIQKCIECVPTEKIDFIISAFKGQVATLSTHPYGCRVIQRVLEHCSGDLQCRSIVDEILESAYDLAQDQYGNYVTQHVLERGNPSERSQIISKLSGKFVQLSQHKYASNVVEKCLEFGAASEQELLIEEILVQSEDNDSLLTMMKDQFANYVVQKILEISNEKQKEILLERIRLHLLALKKYTYGKHIVARVEQLSGEADDGSSEP